MRRRAFLPASTRPLLVLPAAALVVHHLRYLLAYGGGARDVLTAQGHSYLDSFAPWIVLLLAVGFGNVVRRVALALATGHAPRPRRSAAWLWVVATVGLVAIYAAQELLEGFFASGHPGGIAAVLGAGGWWAIPAAVVVGGAVAFLARVVAAIEAFAAGLAREVVDGCVRAAVQALRVVARRRSTLASAAAGRAPPASSLV